jgi:hypothetical protein
LFVAVLTNRYGYLAPIGALPNKQNNEQTIAIAMIGYRNASVLLSVRGAVSPGLSSNFGLSWMVQDLRNDTKYGGLVRYALG